MADVRPIEALRYDLDVVGALQDVVGPNEFREVLDHASPGIFDPRSWAYWNLKCGRDPAPPLPVRHGLQPVQPQP